MSTAQLLEQFERLSPFQQREAEDFIRFLAASERNGESLPPFSKYDESYLNSLIEKARSSWVGIHDVDEWVQDIRGYAHD
jgi:hypothetical protein